MGVFTGTRPCRVGEGVGAGAAPPMEARVAGGWAACSAPVGVVAGGDESMAACDVAGTGTDVAARSGSGSCPHPANNKMLNDSANRRFQCTLILLANGISVHIVSFSSKVVSYRIIRSGGDPGLVYPVAKFVTENRTASPIFIISSCPDKLQWRQGWFGLANWPFCPANLGRI